MKKDRYNDQVFINCPFDNDYFKFFFSIIFTVLDCGFIPRCSKEVDDATQFRLGAIVDLISQCKYGIHDLSRVELGKRNKLPRFNMPFELGIFYGAKYFGEDIHKKKICAVLEKRLYRYQKYISDISGMDIKAHNNSMKRCVIEVRNWLSTNSKRTTIPEAEKIYARYRRFRCYLKRACKVRRINYHSMPFIELSRYISEWLEINEEIHEPLITN